MSVDDAVEARVIALNASTGTVITAVWLKRSPGSVGEPSKVESHTVQPGSQPDSSLPWFENAGGSARLRFATRHILAYSYATVYLQKQNFLKSFIFSFLSINNVLQWPVTNDCDRYDNPTRTKLIFYFYLF